jgi:hypothetical protein
MNRLPVLPKFSMATFLLKWTDPCVTEVFHSNVPTQINKLPVLPKFFVVEVVFYEEICWTELIPRPFNDHI